MIRLARETDVGAILEIYAPYVENTTCSFEYTPPDYEAFLQRFRHITDRFPWLVWEEDGQLLGYAYASAPFERAAYSWCVEPSIYLAPKARRRGIGKKLYLALEAILKEQGFRVSYAVVTSENKDSLAFHRALGYEFMAEFPDCGFKFGRWLGITWLQKALNPSISPSNMPVKCSAIVKDARNLREILDTLSLS